MDGKKSGTDPQKTGNHGNNRGDQQQDKGKAKDAGPGNQGIAAAKPITEPLQIPPAVVLIFLFQIFSVPVSFYVPYSAYYHRQRW
jgi:hypothetical protein